MGIGRRRGRSTAFALLAFGIAGCASVLGLEGYDPGEGGDSPEAGPDATDAFDASTGDADADAAVAVDADAGSALQGCASAALADASFCVDFEGAKPLEPPTWSSARGLGVVGTVDLVQDASISAPNAARFGVADAAGGCVYLDFAHQLDGTYATARAHVAFIPGATGIFTSLQVAISAGDTIELLVRVESGSIVTLAVQRTQGSTVTPLDTKGINTFGTPVGRWLDVTLDISRAPNRVATMRLAGVTEIATVTLPADLTLLGSPTVRIGPYCVNVPKNAVFDDVALWAE